MTTTSALWASAKHDGDRTWILCQGGSCKKGMDPQWEGNCSILGTAVVLLNCLFNIDLFCAKMRHSYIKALQCITAVASLSFSEEWCHFLMYSFTLRKSSSYARQKPFDVPVHAPGRCALWAIRVSIIQLSWTIFIYRGYAI